MNKGFFEDQIKEAYHLSANITKTVKTATIQVYHMY